MLIRTTPISMLFVLGLAVSLFLGCTGSSQQAQKQTSHLRTLLSMFNSAASQMGRPPKSEEELKGFIQEKGAKVLERLEIAGVDELFLSERDGQPFVVLYGRKPQGVRRDVVAYEQTGVDGIRHVGFDLGMIEDVDEEKFRELVPESAITE